MLRYMIEQIEMIDRPGSFEAHLILWRDSPIITLSERACVAIGMRKVCELLNDDAPGRPVMLAHAGAYCDRIYGSGGWTKHDLFALVACIEDQFGNLLKCAPRLLTDAEKRQQRKRDGLIVRINGDVVMDARDG